MKRRQFMLSSICLGTSFLALGLPLATPASSARKPVILHTATVRPKQHYVDPDNIYRTIYPSERPRLIDQGVSLSVGEELAVDLISIDMGNHLIGIYRDGLEIARFRSFVVGGLIEREEPLSALISDSVGDELFRIDIILDRPVFPGERIPLLDPVREKYGISAQMVAAIEDRQADPDAWFPLGVREGHHYYPWRRRENDGDSVPDSYNSARLQMPEGLVRIPEQRADLWNPTPWRDLNPATASWVLPGDGLAYFPSNFNHQLPQMLLRGEQIEGHFIGFGNSFPYDLLTNLSLVA